MFDVWGFYEVALKAPVLQRNLIYINIHYSTEAWEGLVTQGGDAGKVLILS